MASGRFRHFHTRRSLRASTPAAKGRPRHDSCGMLRGRELMLGRTGGVAVLGAPPRHRPSHRAWNSTPAWRLLRAPSRPASCCRDILASSFGKGGYRVVPSPVAASEVGTMNWIPIRNTEGCRAQTPETPKRLPRPDRQDVRDHRVRGRDRAPPSLVRPGRRALPLVFAGPDTSVEHPQSHELS